MISLYTAILYYGLAMTVGLIVAAIYAAQQRGQNLERAVMLANLRGELEERHKQLLRAHQSAMDAIQSRDAKAAAEAQNMRDEAQAQIELLRSELREGLSTPEEVEPEDLAGVGPHEIKTPDGRVLERLFP